MLRSFCFSVLTGIGGGETRPETIPLVSAVHRRRGDLELGGCGKGLKVADVLRTTRGRCLRAFRLGSVILAGHKVR